jgi:hypothetical protein
MIMAEVLDSENVSAGANGRVSGKLYCTVTATWFPGLLHGPVAGQVLPEA